jgi:RimJ/RimL family protein N-acetyltransferase
MELRNYQKNDAKIILTWINNEREFRLWSADRYKDYPITDSDINNNYDECIKSNSFYPLTLVDDGKVIGHLILRNPGEDQSVIRMGFIIVDSSIRGHGYGKKIIELAINYAREILNAKEINLGVFTCNTGALKCYEKSGFEIIDIEKDAYTFHDEKWDCAEMMLRK